MPDQTSSTPSTVLSGAHSVPGPNAVSDQLLVDLLEATSHSVDVEDYIACHNAGASHADILEAHAHNALLGYATYCMLGTTHAELLDTRRITIDLKEIFAALGTNGLVKNTTIVVDQTVQDSSYRIGREHGLSHAQMQAVHRGSVYITAENPIQLTLTATTHPVRGATVTNVHSPLDCTGEYCCVHNPSVHHMLTWPQVWDQPKHQMQRQCPHGEIHPDPDDPATQTIGGRIHPCDGCCTPPQ